MFTPLKRSGTPDYVAVFYPAGSQRTIGVEELLHTVDGLCTAHSLYGRYALSDFTSVKLLVAYALIFTPTSLPRAVTSISRVIAELGEKAVSEVPASSPLPTTLSTDSFAQWVLICCNSTAKACHTLSATITNGGEAAVSIGLCSDTSYVKCCLILLIGVKAKFCTGGSVIVTTAAVNCIALINLLNNWKGFYKLSIILMPCLRKTPTPSVNFASPIAGLCKNNPLLLVTA